MFNFHWLYFFYTDSCTGGSKLSRSILVPLSSVLLWAAPSPCISINLPTEEKQSMFESVNGNNWRQNVHVIHMQKSYGFNLIPDTGGTVYVWNPNPDLTCQSSKSILQLLSVKAAEIRVLKSMQPAGYENWLLLQGVGRQLCQVKSLYEMHLPRIMAVVFNVLDWRFLFMNTATMILCSKV